MRRLTVLAVMLVAVATACKLETNFGAIINADGSGTIVIEIGLDDEAAQMFLQGQDPFESNDLAGLPGARTSQEKRGDLTYYKLETDVEDITAAEDQLVDNESTMLSNLDITVTDTRVAVSGNASAQDALGAEASGFDPGVLEDSISASVYFTLPGHIISHNADRQDGNTLYWDIPIVGGSLDIQAESDPTGTPAPASGNSSDGFPSWAYVVIAVIVLGAIFYFMKGRPATAGTAAAESNDDDSPPPPPPPTSE